MSRSRRLPFSIYLSLASAFLVAAAAGAQTFEIGTDVIAPNTSDIPFSVVRTDIDLVRPATATGVLDTATFHWAAFPCLGAAEVVFYRRQGDTLVFLDERGPFDVVASPMSVSLTPPVPVQEGDLIGLVRLTDCGNPAALNGFASAGYVAYAGDSHSNLSLAAANATSADVLAVFATGTATESVARVIPAAASTPGNFGSFFKTGVQLSNPYSSPLAGRFVFHPAGTSGSSADPSLTFTVGAGQTVSYSDLVADIGTGGLGSIDIVIPEGAQLPIIVTRVFNDAGASGTSGFTEDTVNPDGGSAEGSLLFAGSTGFMIAPADLTDFRFNIGVRTFLQGAFITFRVFDSTGTLIHTTTKNYNPTYYEQQSSDSFLGVALQANDMIEVSVSSGSAVVYGATTDNTTNDPSIQFVRVTFAVL